MWRSTVLLASAAPHSIAVAVTVCLTNPHVVRLVQCSSHCKQLHVVSLGHRIFLLILLQEKLACPCPHSTSLEPVSLLVKDCQRQRTESIQVKHHAPVSGTTLLPASLLLTTRTGFLDLVTTSGAGAAGNSSMTASSISSSTATCGLLPTRMPATRAVDGVLTDLVAHPSLNHYRPDHQSLNPYSPDHQSLNSRCIVVCLTRSSNHQGGVTHQPLAAAS